MLSAYDSTANARVLSEDQRVTYSDVIDLVHELLDDLQRAVRAKSHAAALDLFTEDAALLGTAAANLDRDAVSNYLALVLDQTGYVRWDWEEISVLDSRPGAITFVALGLVRLEDHPEDDSPSPIRLTCLAVEETERWRLRLFHGSIPSS
jgi:uncharacterized protein (TIGR02246 family)